MFSLLETWRAEYGRGRMRMTSGYRCPHVNSSVPGSAQYSRHMWGDAADIVSMDQPWGYDEWQMMRDAAYRAGASFVEPWGTGPGQTTTHCHADWR